jgi:outer membrane biosynthesis protein TonB
VADEQEEKPEGEAPAEDPQPESSQETAVGHSVVEEPARETAVGHSVVDAGTDAGATEVFFSRDEPAAAASAPTPAPQPATAPPPPSSGTSPAAADRHAAESHDSFSQKPELFIGGAFVGAFVLGKLLKKLTGRGN